MSRIQYNEVDDLHSLLNAGRWIAQVRSSFLSPKGQKALREIRDAIIALPEKKLIADRLCDGENVCAVGAYALAKGVSKEQMVKRFPIEVHTWGDGSKTENYDWQADDIADWANPELGISRVMAWEIQEENDEQLETATPEERYVKVLEWLNRWIENPQEEYRKYHMMHTY